MAHCRRFKSHHSSRRVASAILATGVQARPHVEAMRCVRNFGKIRVSGRTPKKITAFTQKHGCVAMSAGNLVHGAEVVVTATRSQEPALKGERLQEAAHVNAVGAAITTWREFNDDVMSRCTFILHSREACLKESGDATQPGADIHCQIAEVLAGTAKVEPR